MGIKKYSPYTPSRRNMTGLDFSVITKSTPEKSLLAPIKKNSGRNIVVAVQRENTELSTLREIQRMEFLQKLLQ